MTQGLKELGGPAYLVRLAGAAISAYAARDYAQMIYDLAVRRELIGLGRDISARAAKGRGRQRTPRPDHRGRTAPVQTGRTRRRRAWLPVLPQGRHRRRQHGQRRLSARRRSCRHLDRPGRPRQEAGRPAPFRPSDPRRPPLDGQDLARHQHRLQHRQGLQARHDARGRRRCRRRRRRRLLLAGNERRTACRPYPVRSLRSALRTDPPRRHDRSRNSAALSRPPRRWNPARSTSTTPPPCRSRRSPPAPAA